MFRICGLHEVLPKEAVEAFKRYNILNYEQAVLQGPPYVLTPPYGM